MSLRYFMKDFDMFRVAPNTTGITFVFATYVPCISVVRSVYFKIFTASVVIIYLTPEVALSINKCVFFPPYHGL
jgi:hypothetical protein